jgi:hypothetical protein
MHKPTNYVEVIEIAKNIFVRHFLSMLNSIFASSNHLNEPNL